MPILTLKPAIMKKFSFRKLENLVYNLRSLDPSLKPSIYHKHGFYGVRVCGLVCSSYVLELIRVYFKPFMYFVECDSFNHDYFLFTIHVKLSK